MATKTTTEEGAGVRARPIALASRPVAVVVARRVASFCARRARVVATAPRSRSKARATGTCAAWTTCSCSCRRSWSSASPSRSSSTTGCRARWRISASSTRPRASTPPRRVMGWRYLSSAREGATSLARHGLSQVLVRARRRSASRARRRSARPFARGCRWRAYSPVRAMRSLRVRCVA